MSENSAGPGWKSSLFKYRSYTPIPFLIVMLLFAHPTGVSLAVGFLIAALGESIRFWGVSYAGSETRTTGRVGGTKLVTSGPYAHVRNPLYLGNILLYAGVGVMSNALEPYLQIGAVIYFWFQYSAIVTLEEEYLAGTFSEWNDYQRSVPRFIPRLSSYTSGSTLMPDNSRALRSERSSLLAFGSITCILIVMSFFRGPH